MPIPTWILSGFLGSGKTTLLLRLLLETRQRGLRPGILMNELGKQDVDGRIVAEHGEAALEKLLDGCICCSKKEELAAAVEVLLSGNPDLIVIELTGVADPQEVIALLAQSACGSQLQIRQVLTVLDAEHVLEYNSVFASDRQLVRTLRHQIEAADLLIVNKSDLAAPRQLPKIDKTIRKLNGHAAILHTVHSQFDLAPLLGGIVAKPAQTAAQPSSAMTVHPAEDRTPGAAAFPIIAKHQHTPHEADSYSQIRTITMPVPTDWQVPRAALEQFLQQWSSRIIRAKGYIQPAGQNTMALMQFSGSRVEWAASSYSGSPYLVFIGIAIDEPQLLADWQSFCQSASLLKSSK